MKKTIFIILIIASLVLGATAVFSQSYNLPYVSTGSATSIGNNYATLSGQVNPNGYQTTYYFEYGQTTSLGQTTPSQIIGSSYSYSNVAYQISGINNNVTYYYRIDAYNAYGSTQGSIMSFSTNGNGNYNVYNLSITTNAATNISSNYATLNSFASVSETYQGSTWFEYGTDPNYLINKTIPAVVPAASYYRNSNSSPYFTYQLNNLNPNTTYYFRAGISSSDGTSYISYGQTLMFTTYGNSLTYTPTYNYTNPVSYNYVPDNSNNNGSNSQIQYVYETPKIIYIDANGNQYNPQNQNINNQNANTSNFSNAAYWGNQYYAPYYGMQTVVPSSYSYGLGASVIGSVGYLNQNSLFGLILIIILVFLIVAGILKEAF